MTTLFSDINLVVSSSARDKISFSAIWYYFFDSCRRFIRFHIGHTGFV